MRPRLPDCVLCGSPINKCRDYLKTPGLSLRNLGYVLPSFALKTLAAASSQLGRKFGPALTNRTFFGDKTLLWCDACGTGFSWPPFTEETLSAYYGNYYWNNRADRGQFLDNTQRGPLDKRVGYARARLQWVLSHNVAFSTAMDFGSGDCSGAKALSEHIPTQAITAIDASPETQANAAALGIGYATVTDGLAPVDLLYASHAIEHVHDLAQAFDKLIAAVVPGGHIFLEFPNIANYEIFEQSVHTPHTFLLSRRSIEKLVEGRPVRLIAMEESGEQWRKYNPQISSDAKGALRVLLQKAQ